MSGKPRRGRPIAPSVLFCVVMAGCTTPIDWEAGELAPITVRDLPADRAGSEPASACGQIPESGICSQGVLFVCDPRTREVRQTSCASMEMLCVSSPSGSECSAPATTPGEEPTSVEEDPLCGGVSTEGFCDESGAATWCDPAEGVAVWACPEFGLRCEMTEEGAYCVGEASSECDDLGIEGECAGGVARYCIDDVLYEERCADSGETCQIDTCAYGADCCPVEGESECLRLGYEGECVGNVARFCFDGMVYEDECSGFGMTCEYDQCDVGAACCESEADRCAELGLEGRCVGEDAAEYCFAGSIEVETCESGATCLFDVCLSGAAGCCDHAQVCDDLPDGGSCVGPEGNTVIRCVSGEPVVEECGSDRCSVDPIDGAACGDRS